jgi:heme/copper-type cytochrome/quinol oxidase subunit 2
MVVGIKASRYSFSPEIVRVPVGTLVQFNILSAGGTHGFRLSDFGVDVRLEENDVQTVEVYFPKTGEYGFRCSHFCGLGHLGMTGKIIVE